jgi:hypothetical protein
MSWEPSLVDWVEHYGSAVENGELTQAGAAQALAAASEGGVTEAGAAGLIDNWRTARARYQAIADEAARRLVSWRAQH